MAGEMAMEGRGNLFLVSLFIKDIEAKSMEMMMEILNYRVKRVEMDRF